MTMRRVAATMAAMAVAIPLAVLVAAPAAAWGSMTVSPDTGLVDGQIVHVSVTGLAPHASAGMEQCVSGHDIDGCDGSSFVLAITDDHGAFQRDVQLLAVLHTPIGDVDCRTSADPCVLGANTDFTNVGAVFTALAFDPSGPLAPPPTLTVTPSTGLIDQQVVALDGSGFRPDVSLQVLECVAGNPSPHACRSAAAPGTYGVASTALGELHATASPRTVLNAEDGTTTDCRTTACELRLEPDPSRPPVATAALGFDRSGPVAPQAAIGVAADNGLIDGQLVAVSGQGYAPGVGVEVLQCAFTDQISTCDAGSYGTADSSGGFDLDLAVRTRLWAGQILDCRDPATTCVVEGYGFGAPSPQWASHQLSFDASGPLLPPPVLSVTPADGLVDAQVVQLAGSGFPPSSGYLYAAQAPEPPDLPSSARWVPPALPATTGAGAAPMVAASATPAAVAISGPPLPVEECAVGDHTDYSHCNSASSGSAYLAADATLTGTFQVLAQFQGYDGGTVDCRTTSCELRAGWASPLDSATAALAFDPTAPLVSAPPLQADPTEGLADGTPIHVVADGLQPGQGVSFHQCRADTTGFDGCDAGGFQIGQADLSGHLDIVTTAKALLVLSWAPDGVTPTDTFDCTASPGACRLMMVDGATQRLWPSALLSYATATSPSSTSTTAPPAAVAGLVTPAAASPASAVAVQPAFTG